MGRESTVATHYFPRDDSVNPIDRVPSSHTSPRTRCMRHPPDKPTVRKALTVVTR